MWMHSNNLSELVSNAQQSLQYRLINPKGAGEEISTSQFAPKETQVVYQVPFSFSHQAPSDACKAPEFTILVLKL